MVSKLLRHGASALVAASLAVTSAAEADQVQAPDRTEEAPKRLKGVDIVEHLGDRVPESLAFKDQDGKSVTLGDLLHGEVPVILTFNYADCPMLCSQQLNGLTAAMPGALKRGPVAGSENELAFALGEHYRIVTISLEPNESLLKLGRMRDRYLERVAELSKETDKDVLAKRASGWAFWPSTAAMTAG